MGRKTQKELIAIHMGKPGLKGKVTAMCISCSFDETQTQSWVKQVDQCGVEECPLYSVRRRSSGK